MKTTTFEGMTKAEKRVAVAKDVLAQIKARFYKPKKGSYVELPSNAQDSSDLDVKKNFKMAKNCQVCALGACLMSITKVENSITFHDVTRFDSSKKIKKLLLSVFSYRQMAMIEYAFEGWYSGGSGLSYRYTSDDLDYDTRNACYNFHHEHAKGDDFEERSRTVMIAIMKNIIENKGTFKP